MAVGFLAGTGHAHGLDAGDIPKRVFAVGPTLAYGNTPAGGGIVYGLDATYAPTFPVWFGAGFRSFENLNRTDRELLPYAEAGAWYLLSVGGGFTFDVDSGPRNLSGPHLFVGLPLPITTPYQREGDLLLYANPYYRVGFGQDGQIHEVGVMVKWVWTKLMKW